MVSRDLQAHAESRLGAVLNGKWRLVRLLGVGGMAAVYGAEHRNRKRAAVKILHPQFSYDENVKTRFLREGYVANTIDHPGAVTVDDDDVAEDGSAFLVMELLQGEPLDLRQERLGGIVEVHEVVVLMEQLLEVLEVAHGRDVIHRDLKPDNLFLTIDGQLKVLDFGIAHIKELSTAGSSTSIGSMMGTPAFMAPEQARGRWNEVDARSDLWAVGATMFTLLTNRHVHAAENASEQMVKAATEQAPSLGAIRPDLPEPLVTLVDHAIAFDKEARWASARDMRQALARVRSTLPEAPPPAAPESSIVMFEDVDREAHTVMAPSNPSGSAPNVGAEPTLPSASARVPSAADAVVSGREPTVSAAAMSTSAPAPSTPPSSNRRWAIVLAGAAALAVGAVVVVSASNEPSDERVEDNDGIGETTPAAPRSGDDEGVKANDGVTVEPVTDVEDAISSSDAGSSAKGASSPAAAPTAAATQAAKPAKVQAKSTASPKPATRPKPAARPKPAPAPKPAKDDPFSRRF